LSDQNANSQRPQWHPLEAVAGWVAPGLGHILLGERRRGIILMVCISGMWLGGVLVGGMGVVDWQRPNAPFLWFGQAFIAPTLAANWAINRTAGPLIPLDQTPLDDADNALSYRPSFNRVEEQGVLYTAIAGLLNLMAVIDVLYRDPRSARYRQDSPSPEQSAASAEKGAGT